MAFNRSVFPEGGYDIFKESYDLPLSLKPQALEYQNLKIKPSLTPAEVQRLNELTTLLQDYIVTPEKINHFQDAVSATQKFFVENTVGFVESKQTEMNSYVDLKKTEMQTEIDKFNDRGVYSPSIQYFKNNFVTFNDGTSNQTYLCVQDCVNKEPSSNPLFWRKLTIQGAKGVKGDSGANFIFKGAWDIGITYAKDEAVQYGGILFVSKINVNAGNEPNPLVETAYWSKAMDLTITVKQLIGTRNAVTQTSNVNFMVGEITSFNPSIDSLEVYMNSIRLTKGVDYTINANNQSIDKVSDIWDGNMGQPIFFEFVVTKNLLNNLVFKDGSALDNGTVTRNKLDIDTQAEINKVSGIETKVGNGTLTTTAQDIVGAINEHENDISSVSSQLAQLMNDWDFGLITSSPTSTDDFGSIV